MKKTPKLRFPEFKDNWESKRLNEIGVFFKGSGLSKADLSEEGTPCILYGQLYTTYGEVIDNIESKTQVPVNKLVMGNINDVLIPSSGESAIDIATASCLQKSNVALGGDLNVFRPHDVDGVFISYQLNNTKRTEIAKIAQGASVVHVYNEQLKQLKVDIPSQKEQERIAEFFSLIDKKINIQKAKIDQLEIYKEGIIQKIFSKQLRFKDKLGNKYPEWRQEVLGDYIIEYIEKSEVSNQYPVLTSSRQGLKLQEEHFNGRQITTDDNIGYHIMPYDYVTFRSRSDDGYFRFNINKIIKKGLVSYFYPVFTFDEGLNSDFAVTYMNKYLCKQIIKEVVGTSQLVLSLNKLRQLSIPIPHIEEQQKIATIINGIDMKINLELDKLQEFINWKQGLINKMLL